MNTILESGITALTRPVGAQEFSFDEFTRQMELVNFFSYCRIHGLVGESGEYSRLSLIRKTYNHRLTANYDNSLEAERAWLQLKTSSASTDREILWKLFFAQHVTTPDEVGITYNGLSLESSYRKFLDQHIGDIFTFDENAYITDSLSFLLGQVFQDITTISELVSFLKQIYRQLSDTCRANEIVAVLMNKGFADTSAFTDSLRFNISKTFNDQILVNEQVFYPNLTEQDDNSLFNSETSKIFESVTFTFIKLFEDYSNVSESLSLQKYLLNSDVTNTSENLSYLMTIGREFNNLLNAEDVTFLLMGKNYADSLTMTDELYISLVGFNSGRMGGGRFGA